MNPEELQRLIAAAGDDTLSPQEASGLLAACRKDPAVLAQLARHIGTERMLHAVCRDPRGRVAAKEVALRIEQERVASVVSPGFIERVVEHSQRSRRWPRLAIAAGIALAGFLGLLQWQSSRPEQEVSYPVEGPTTELLVPAPAVAVLKRAVEVRWADGASPAVGQMLPAGWLKLQAGTAQVEFLSGTLLILVGPAELRLESENAAFIQSGKASAYVPEPARGFLLRAPGMDVVDLGTAFGIDVSKTKQPEVHVFDGEVSIARGSQPARKIEAHQAVRIDEKDLLQIPVMPAEFPNGEELASRADSAARTRLNIWQQVSARLASDPASLIAYHFAGDPDWSPIVRNHALQAPAESSGALVNAARTEGRWPGKSGLEFRSLGDRLRFAVPGKHRALTLMAWVRVDSLPNDYNSLLLPSRYSEGSLHWTLERGGELRLTMLHNPQHPLNTTGWDGPASGTAISSMDFGRWIFLVTTYDSSTGLVTHYRDGQIIGKGQFRHKLPALLGSMEFGNWGADPKAPGNWWIGRQPSRQRTRNFVGKLDELNILSRALSPAEVAELYQYGKP